LYVYLVFKDKIRPNIKCTIYDYDRTIYARDIA